MEVPENDFISQFEKQCTTKLLTEERSLQCNIKILTDEECKMVNKFYDRRHKIQAVESLQSKNANQLSNQCVECFNLINGVEFERIICKCAYHPECLLRVLIRHGITDLGNFPCKCMSIVVWKC